MDKSRFVYTTNKKNQGCGTSLLKPEKNKILWKNNQKSGGSMKSLSKC
jgi:hypothetical protein